MRRLLRVLMLAVVAGTAVPATIAGAAPLPAASPGPPRFGVRLVDVPVSEAHNPRALRYIIDRLPAGSVIHRRIMVLNQETRTVRFSVYPDAATITHGYFIGDAGHTRSELTSWIHVAHPKVRLRAHRSAMDMITIRVPQHATRGEHYAVIWVQQTARVRTARGFAIREISRVGIRVYLAVGRGGAPAANFTITGIASHRTAQGRLVLTAEVHNTGGRAVDLSGTARLTDGPGGTSAGPFPVDRIITLAPGQAYPVTFVMSRHLPDGPWHPTITLVSGFTRRTSSATILLGGRLGAGAWRRPGTMAVLAVLILVIPALVVFGVRRARSPRRAAA